MVAPTDPVPPTGGFAGKSSTTGEEHWRFSSVGGRTNPGGIRRLVASVARLTDIQLQIWLTRVKLAAWSIALYAALFGAAALIGILGVIFLMIGIFHVLTDVAGLAPVWAFLIFGGGLLILAGVLVAIAKSVLTKRSTPKHAGGGK
jgi:hypothetical protein